MIKGQKVRLVEGGKSGYTEGNVYTVLRGEGDIDDSMVMSIGIMNDTQFNIADDDGDIRFEVYPTDGIYNTWELVEQ